MSEYIFEKNTIYFSLFTLCTGCCKIYIYLPVCLSAFPYSRKARIGFIMYESLFA